MYKKEQLREIWDTEAGRMGDKVRFIDRNRGKIDGNVTIFDWGSEELKVENWWPIKASEEPEMADLMPNGVVLYEDIQAIDYLVEGNHVKTDTVQLFLRYWKLELTCSACKSDGQLLQSPDFEVFPQGKHLSSSQIDYIINTFAAILPLYDGIEIRQWVISLEKQVNSQFHTKQILSQTADFSLWLQFAYNDDSNWNLLRLKAISSPQTSKLVYFYHSFLRKLELGALEEGIGEVLEGLECSDTLAGLCKSQELAGWYESKGGWVGQWCVQYICEAMGIWLLYLREDLSIAWRYFSSLKRPERCSEKCTCAGVEWRCEQAARMLRYHEDNNEVFIKTEVRDKYEELVACFPRNPRFIRGFCRYCSDPVLSLQRVIQPNAYHWGLIMTELKTWQVADIVKKVTDLGDFPEHKESWVLLWEKYAAMNCQAGLVAVRNLPFCKKIYITACSQSKQPQDLIAALSERELHLRIDPFISSF